MNPIPRSEHPVPNFQRRAWTTLNGSWQFAFDPDAIGEQMRWYGPGHVKEHTITVPFPWESKLSGLVASGYKGAAWYQREITVPAEWTDLAPYLHFGAVDWLARVWINGKLVAEHANGYLPFAVDLRSHLAPGETGVVTVRAYDIAEATTLVGKQVPRWYTYSSGIWQSVWLEGRPASHITALRVTPDLDQGRATIEMTLTIDRPRGYTVRVRSTDDAFPAVSATHQWTAGQHTVTLNVAIPEPQPWSPATPYLYDFVAELAPDHGSVDQVRSYFGLRQVGRGRWQDNDYEYIMLNHEPVYLRGALDQAFYPESLHAYPSDAAIRGDIQLAKDLGLNMLRCHIKINDPRYYYWADRLGLLMMYDLPSPDLDTPSMRRIFEQTLRRAIARDFNSPAIFAWILFNETWGLSKHDSLEGQRWVQQMYHLAKELDPTRLVEDNSVCRYDHVESDINSWHFYLNDYRRARQHVQRVVDETYAGSVFNYVGGDFVQENAPLINSEYAGISARMGDQDIAWSFKFLTTDLRRHDKICGYVYTELADIEWEHNGFVNYDRSAKEFGYDFFVPGMTIADLNAPDLVGLDAPPCQTLAPGDRFVAPLFVSHWGPQMAQGAVRWQLDFIDRFGERRTQQEGAFPVAPQRFQVTHVADLDIALPAEPGLAIVALQLIDERETVRSRNYVQVEVRAGDPPAAEPIANGWALRFQPSHFARTNWDWPVPYTDPGGAKFSAVGAGWVEYTVPVPEAVDLSAVRGLRLLFEAAARAGLAKVDWPQRLNGLNYPQTEAGKQHSTQVVISINDVEIGALTLPDDPADARGSLSHYRGVDPGAYGFLRQLVVDADTVASLLDNSGQLRVRFTVPLSGQADGLRVLGGALNNANTEGGLALFGDTLGCYPVAPTLFLETSD